MPRIATGGVIGPLPLNRQAVPPLHRQLYDELRALILSGRLAPGSKLPSTRLLARSMESRATPCCRPSIS